MPQPGNSPIPGAAPLSGAGFCSICQTRIIAGDDVANCPDCGLPFHRACWAENGGCAQYGCASAPQTAKPDALAEFASNVWGEEKSCPNCGKKIKAKAVKCRFCQTIFHTRDAISAQAFASQEYDGGDYIKARNCIIAAFLLSGTGILSLPMLAVMGLFVSGCKIAGVQYKRLPAALKTLSWVTLGVDCLLVLLMLVLIALD